MRWELSEEQADFRSVLREWLQERCASATLRGWLDTGDPGPFEQQLAAEGWSAVGSPEELGGQGGGLVELALEIRRSEAASVPGVGGPLLRALARLQRAITNEEQRRVRPRN